jgi:hypothetical protein
MADVDKELARRTAAWRATVAASLKHGSSWFYVDVRSKLPCILPGVSREECERIAKAAGVREIHSLKTESALAHAERLIRDDVERQASIALARTLSPLPGLGGRA